MEVGDRDPRLEAIVLASVTRNMEIDPDLRERAEDYVRMTFDLVTTDELTGLQNRRGAGYKIRLMFEQGRGVVALMDLDKFKEENDAMGHAYGDKVLKAVGQYVTARLNGGTTVSRGRVEHEDEPNHRFTDTINRPHGDEFILTLPSYDLSQAKKMAEALIRDKDDFVYVEDGVRYEGILKNINFSIGIAEIAEGNDIEAILKKADDALYLAKEEGRGRVVIGSEEVSRKLAEYRSKREEGWSARSGD